MAEAAADARTYERDTIHTISDVWDNNTFPLFRAMAARTSWGRERRARAALRWMADLGTERRTWMVEQSAIAGYALEPLLPPPAKGDHLVRDHRGDVMASVTPLTTDVAAGIGVDYELATAEVRSLMVERTGTRLTASLVLAVRRRYASDRSTGERAELRLWVQDVADTRFDSRDASGITLGLETGEVAIGIGAQGVLRAARATVYPDDPTWHLSTAGRSLDARTPTGPRPSRRQSPPRRRESLDDGPLLAATILHDAMLEIRTVRYAAHAGRIPVLPLCLVFAGAGEAIMAASIQSRREEAFRHLVEDWVRKGGPDLAPWFAERLHGLAKQVGGTTREWVTSPAPPKVLLSEPFEEPVSDLPVEAELRLARYDAAHIRYETPRPATALVQLALPPRPHDDRNGFWSLAGFELRSPRLFQLSGTAFHGATRPQLAGDREGIRSLSLKGDALTVYTDEAETRGRSAGQG